MHIYIDLSWFIYIHVVLPGANQKNQIIQTPFLLHHWNPEFSNGCQGTQARGRLRGNRATKGSVAEGPIGVEVFLKGGARGWMARARKYGRQDFIWLVVEPTHLKNMLVKMEIFPKFRGEHEKYLKPPPGYFSKLELTNMN